MFRLPSAARLLTSGATVVLLLGHGLGRPSCGPDCDTADDPCNLLVNGECDVRYDGVNTVLNDFVDCEAAAETCCTPDDPCDWRDNYHCEATTWCADTPDARVDEGLDCSADAFCCTDADDRCGFLGDDVCQNVGCLEFTDDPLYDIGDCCSEDGFGNREYNDLTCGADDLCGWRGDGVCDNTCSALGFPLDDNQDCLLEAEACCRADNACDYEDDGVCDAYCYQFDDHIDETADCRQLQGPTTGPRIMAPAAGRTPAMRQVRALTCAEAGESGGRVRHPRHTFGRPWADPARSIL